MASDARHDTILRLKKIEGQIRGLQRMIDEGKDCADVIHQLCAARKALDKVGFVMLTHHMQDCIKGRDGSDYDAKKAMDEAMKLFLTLA